MTVLLPGKIAQMPKATLDSQNPLFWQQNETLQFHSVEESFEHSIELVDFLPELPPHIGPTLAPEAILFESPCRAHSET